MSSTNSHTFFATKKVMLKKNLWKQNNQKINPGTKVPAQMCLQKKTDNRFKWKVPMEMK